MTDLEINKAIATHIFGWEEYDMLIHNNEPGWTDLKDWSDRKLYGAMKNENKWNKVPDYCNDLNAMHEAERGFSNNSKWDYLIHLHHVMKTVTTAELIFATAKQRAEAFLKTIGKWKD